MLRYKIAYFIFLAAAVGFYLFYPFYLSFFLLCSLLVLTALSAAAAFISAARLGARISADRLDVGRGDVISFTLELRSKSPLPLPMVRAVVRFENRLHGLSREQTAFFSVGARDGATLRYKLSSAFCGQVSAELVKLRVYDYFGLFSLSRRLPAGTYAFVMPDADSLPEQDLLRGNGDDRAAADTAPRPREDDSMEIFGIRAYQRADRLRSIHWKVSMRLDELMVKQFFPLEEPRLTVICELVGGDPQELDIVVAATAGLSRRLTDAGRAHAVEWYDAREGLPLAQRVAGWRDHADMLYALLSSRCGGKEPIALLEHDFSAASAAGELIFYVAGNVPEQLPALAGEYGPRVTVLLCGPRERVTPAMGDMLDRCGVDLVEAAPVWDEADYFYEGAPAEQARGGNRYEY